MSVCHAVSSILSSGPSYVSRQKSAAVGRLSFDTGAQMPEESPDSGALTKPRQVAAPQLHGSFFSLLNLQ